MADSRAWYKLDNAATIIPPTMEEADTRVFRLVCELKEDVDPEILQSALDEALKEYPHMNCCLRRGIFWFYLDEMKTLPKVEEERIQALKALYVPGTKRVLFRVSYFRNRINLEIFHVLADGTGGYAFLRKIVTGYLVMKHGLDTSGIQEDPSSVSEKQADAFRHFYDNSRQATERNFFRDLFPVKAYQLKGEKDENLKEHLIEVTVPTADMLDLAHRLGVTIGVLGTSIYVEAILKEMKHEDYGKPVVVSVPVNLRQFFPSYTTRNFFGTISVSFDPKLYDGTLESILPVIRKEFADKLTDEKIFYTMNTYSSLEHNRWIRFVPLFIKNFVVGRFTSAKYSSVTTSVSNVGRIAMPEICVPYIEKFSTFMACKTVFVCITSFGGHMVFGITTCYKKHQISLNFVRRLVELGIPVEVASNDYELPWEERERT